MFAHHAIDALRGVSTSTKLLWRDRFGQKNHAWEMMAKYIHSAEKFDFGPLHLEMNEAGTYEHPSLTDDECDFWSQGLIPMPAPICWFEYSLSGHESALLIIQDDGPGCITIQRVDYGNYGGTGTKKDAIWSMPVHVQIRPKSGGTGRDGIEITLNHDGIVGKIFETNPNLKNSMAGDAALAMYLTMMLYSRTTERTASGAPNPKVNANREKQKKSPFFSHTIVRIVPHSYIRKQTEKDGEKRTSPRLHWRRAHVRRYKNGKTKVIHRMLVGRAELGEVTHDYVVTRPEPR